MEEACHHAIVREEGDTALLGHRHGGVVGAGWASPLGPSCERGKPFRHQELPSERDWLLGCCSCGHRHSGGCHLCNKIHQERAIEDPLRTSATAKIDHKKNENKKYSSSLYADGWVTCAAAWADETKTASRCQILEWQKKSRKIPDPAHTVADADLLKASSIPWALHLGSIMQGRAKDDTAVSNADARHSQVFLWPVEGMEQITVIKFACMH